MCRWDRAWGWMASTTCESSPRSCRYVDRTAALLILNRDTHMCTCAHTNTYKLWLKSCLASDLLCRNADRFPKGVFDAAQRPDRQLLGSVRQQVRSEASALVPTPLHVSNMSVAMLNETHFSAHTVLCCIAGCWILSSVRTMAAAGRTVIVGMTTQLQDTHSSTKFAWTLNPWAWQVSRCSRLYTTWSKQTKKNGLKVQCTNVCHGVDRILDCSNHLPFLPLPSWLLNYTGGHTQA